MLSRLERLYGKVLVNLQERAAYSMKLREEKRGFAFHWRKLEGDVTTKKLCFARLRTQLNPTTQ